MKRKATEKARTSVLAGNGTRTQHGVVPTFQILCYRQREMICIYWQKRRAVHAINDVYDEAEIAQQNEEFAYDNGCYPADA